LQQCRDLGEYAEFIQTVRVKARQSANLDESMELAVRECIKRGILRDFLTTHSSEVVNMLTQEWNLDDCLLVKAEETREDMINYMRQAGASDDLIRKVKSFIPAQSPSSSFATPSTMQCH
jgi:hypothetical protein